jgi:hypothetical protein
MEIFQPLIDFLNAIVGLLQAFVALLDHIVSSISDLFV